jgi:hypothetical protein
MVEQKVKFTKLAMGVRESLELNAFESAVNKEDMAKRNYIQYTEQDKKISPNYMFIENMRMKEVSEKLNINSSVLYRWKTEK